MRLQAIGLAVFLSACSAQIYESEAPQGEPPSRQKIAEHIAQIFTESSHATDILVTPAQPAVEHGLFGWLVCVRARVSAISGGDAGFQTFAVFFQRQQMVARRRTEPQDKCEGFERLNAPS
jgi:hypothetical protein